MTQVDYAALAEQARQTAPPASAAIDYAALAAQARGEAPTFRTSNEKDAGGAAVVDPNTLGTFASHIWSQANPIAAINAVAQALPIPKALGGGGVAAPLETIAKIGAAQGELFDKAKASYEKGDYGTAARHFVDYLIPVFGPILDRSSDLFQAGKWAAGGGDAIGLGLAMFGPKAVADGLAARARVPGAPEVSKLTPPEQASNAFAAEQGIPLDAATATGSRTVRAIQKRVANSMGGEGTAERLIQSQQQGLTQAGDRLAEQAHPEPVTAEQAGDRLRGSVTGLIRTLNTSATTAYEKLRALETDPANAADVPRAATADEVVANTQRTARMERSLGRVPTDAEIAELRRIREELDALPFTRGKLVQDAPGLTSDTHYVPRAAGAPVYDDIMQAAPGTSTMTRGEVQKSIEAALETGQFTNAAKGALEVAAQRLAGGRGLTKPMLPPGAGAVAPPTTTMLMPVDLRSVKTGLKPMYDELMQAKDIAPPMGAKAAALQALHRLMQGPDFAPVSVADSALSDLKALARADMPEMRSPGQARAATAVKALDTVVKQAVWRAGPEAVQALEEGRSATVAKYQVADVLDQLKAEPVQMMRQLTAPKDSAIQLLRQVREVAPENMEHLARAYLEDALSLATERGRFDHADKLYANWQKLGPATKNVLFPQPGQIQALDQFFLLAKRVAENPNPSGTAHTLTALNVGSQPVMYALAKILYTPGGANWVTKALSMPSGANVVTQAVRKAIALGADTLAASPLKTPQAARAGVWANVLRSAEAAGPSVPRAADSTNPKQQ